MSKEWKGNSASVRSRLAINKEHTTKEREQDDFYAIDPKALQMLLNKCSYWLHNYLLTCKNEYKCIWEPACGTGNLADVLLSSGFDVCASDLKNRGYGKPNLDFLRALSTAFPIILTNPPYSLATEFIEHALDILPDDGLYIALMNICYLAGQKRFERVYSKGTLREVYIFSKRVQCYKNGDMSIKHSSMADFAWYVFQKGYKGQPTLYWL